VPFSEFRLVRRVQFYETDAAGIVHFSWFFRYMEEAEHALWRAAGISIHPPDSEVGWPRIGASCQFRRPLRFEDEFEVRLRVAEITKRTMRYTCVLAIGAAIVANGELTIACVLKRPNEPMKAIDIPPQVAALFSVAAEQGE
jgi:YbgC/YbaW family acyl-CoA thioester hydrolase